VNLFTKKPAEKPARHSLYYLATDMSCELKSMLILCMKQLAKVYCRIKEGWIWDLQISNILYLELRKRKNPHKNYPYLQRKPCKCQAEIRACNFPYEEQNYSRESWEKLASRMRMYFTALTNVRALKQNTCI